ncbi:acyltransferase [Planctomycetota bacterium]
MVIRLEHDWFPEPLPDNVELGSRSWLYSSFAFRHYRSQKPCGLHVGHDSGLYHGTFFDLGPAGEVEIGNFCTLVGAIFATNGKVLIGDYSFVAHEVVIADSFTALAGPTNRDSAIIIGENVWIGARAVILSGAKIGEGAIIGAAAVVDFEVPAYAIVAGNPAHIKGMIKKGN